MDGLSGLTSVGGELAVFGNPNLMFFCGLYPLLDAAGLVGPYTVSGNAANPTEQDILDEGPCDPADTIQALLDAGVINRGQARALGRLVNNPGLPHALQGWVHAGILTKSEAQLLEVIAGL